MIIFTLYCFLIGNGLKYCYNYSLMLYFLVIGDEGIINKFGNVGLMESIL